jgi:type II secretory pathway pseudopilin PulG
VSLRVAAGRRQDGLTVVELTVVMAVMVLVTAILLGLLDHTTAVYKRASDDVQAENEGRLALRTMTEDIRAASPASIAFTGAVVGACPATPTPATCLRFTIERDTTANPSCRSVVTYGLMGDWVQQTRDDSGCPSNPNVSRKLVTGVANGPTPLFSYYDDSGAALSSGQAAASSVKVTLLVSYQGAPQPLTLSSTLSLRNAR